METEVGEQSCSRNKTLVVMIKNYTKAGIKKF